MDFDQDVVGARDRIGESRQAGHVRDRAIAVENERPAWIILRG